MKRAISASNVMAASGRRAAEGSRWRDSSDDIPIRPQHDFSSMCSPGRALANEKVLAASLPADHTTFEQGLPLSLSSSDLVSQLTTPSTSTKNSASFSCAEMSKNLRSLPMDERNKDMTSKSSLYPEILVPATPSRSAAGSNPDGLLTPGSTVSGGIGGSLQSKLLLLPPATPESARCQGAMPLPYAGVTPHVTNSKGFRSSWQQQVPETPGVSIALGELDTPGGFVSELTNASSLLSVSRGSLLSQGRKGKLSTFMNGMQTTLLHEGEYHQDKIPKTARRYSLDSVSYIGDTDLDATTNDPHNKSLLGNSALRESQRAPVPSKTAELMNDNAPREVRPQMSHASKI